MSTFLYKQKKVINARRSIGTRNGESDRKEFVWHKQNCIICKLLIAMFLGSTIPPRKYYFAMLIVATFITMLLIFQEPEISYFCKCNLLFE